MTRSCRIFQVLSIKKYVTFIVSQYPHVGSVPLSANWSLVSRVGQALTRWPLDLLWPKKSFIPSYYLTYWYYTKSFFHGHRMKDESIYHYDSVYSMHIITWHMHSSSVWWNVVVIFSIILLSFHLNLLSVNTDVRLNKWELITLGRRYYIRSPMFTKR